jgi:eukaryotic-like serine/threonine-protein kinase
VWSAEPEERADSAYRSALAMRHRLLGPEHPEYAWTMFRFADHLVRTRRWSEAAYWARWVLALRGRTLPETYPGVAAAMQYLGRALGPMDSLDIAERWLTESLEHRRTHQPPGQPPIQRPCTHTS